MSKMKPDFRILALSLSLLVFPAFCQWEKPPQSFTDAMESFRQGDYKNAVDRFRQAIVERPSMVKAHYYLGLSLSLQENYGEALTAYNELVQLDPNNILAHYQLAKIHLINEDYRSAIEKYGWLKSLSKQKSDVSEGNGALLPEKPGGVINDWHKQQAGELAQYLLDLMPRDIAEQYDLQGSQVIYTIPSSALSCLKRAPQQGVTDNLQPGRISLTPYDSNRKPPTSGVKSGEDSQRAPADRVTLDNLVRRDDASSIYPMSANLRPTILYREKAKYTEVSRINQVQGTVVLNVVFSVEGKITDIRVNRCLPDGLLQKAIIAAQNIRFNPAIKDGTPVSVRGQLEFSFNLY